MEMQGHLKKSQEYHEDKETNAHLENEETIETEWRKKHRIISHQQQYSLRLNNI